MRASIDTLLAVVSHGSRDAQRYAVMAISNLAATDRTREMLKEKGAETILRKCAQANSSDQMLTSVSPPAPRPGDLRCSLAARARVRERAKTCVLGPLSRTRAMWCVLSCVGGVGCGGWPEV